MNFNNNNNNWKGIVQKTKGILLKLENRKLSIFGKIQIIKTLIIPLFLHIARIFKPTEKTIHEINKILYIHLHSSMGQKRLNSLALLCIENDILQKIDTDDIIKSFALSKSRKCII